MDDQRQIPPGVRTQFLATFDAMGEALRTMERLAELRGMADAWETIVRQLIALRVRVQHGPLGEGVEDAIEVLCLAYDAFVEAVLPNPEVH